MFRTNRRRSFASLELLESRTLLAADLDLSDYTSNADDTLIVTVNSGNLFVNGVDSGVAAAADKIICGDGKGGHDTIDLSALTTSDYQEATLYGGSGNDSLIGGDRPDSLFGESGADMLRGNNGNDTLEGGTGNDAVFGDVGNDTIRVKGKEAASDTTIYGGSGNGDEIVNTGSSDFTLSNFKNVFNENAGAIPDSGPGTFNGGIERIVGNGFALQGTNAVNYFNFNSQGINITGVQFSGVTEVRTAGGHDIVFGTANSFSQTYRLGSGNDAFTAAGSRIDIVYGESGNDSISASGANDTLSGGPGADHIQGSSGDDVILVKGNEAEADTFVFGGTGDDIIYNEGSSDFTLSNVNHNPSGGTDLSFGIEEIQGNGFALKGNNADNHFDLTNVTLNVTEVRTAGGHDVVNGSSLTSISYKLGSGNDQFQGHGSTANIVLGESGKDTLIGSDGNDTLTGGSGSDDVQGGLGFDLLRVAGNDAESDSRLSGGGGLDTILEISGGDIKLSNINNDTDDDGIAEHNAASGTVSGGIEAISAPGQALRGNNATNYFDLSAIDLNVIEVLTAGGHDVVLGAALDNLTYKLGTGNDSFTGSGTANDDVHGESGKDTLVGGDGDDTLTGGSGSDDVRGGAGSDLLRVAGNDAESDNRVSGGSGTDMITNVGSGDIKLSNVNNDTDDDGTADENIGVGTVSGGIEVINGNGHALIGNNANNHFNLSGVDTNVTEVRTAGGHDVVLGSAFDALTYKLGSGNDSFTGQGAINDTVLGESGADTLAGGAGDDRLNGGFGGDAFVFAVGDAEDTIEDFQSGADVVNLTDFGFADFADFLSSATFGGGADLEIDFGAGDILNLLDYTFAELNAGDVIV